MLSIGLFPTSSGAECSKLDTAVQRECKDGCTPHEYLQDDICLIHCKSMTLWAQIWLQGHNGTPWLSCSPLAWIYAHDYYCTSTLECLSSAQAISQPTSVNPQPTFSNASSLSTPLICKFIHQNSPSLAQQASVQDKHLLNTFSSHSVPHSFFQADLNPWPLWPI